MHIEHIAIWTKNLEPLKVFYETYFGAKASPKYVNQQTGFESYFLSFPSGARLEIMSVSNLLSNAMDMGAPMLGYAHMAISAGTKDRVEKLTKQLEAAGIQVISQPRYTGDGYFESMIADPDGNLIELTI